MNIRKSAGLLVMACCLSLPAWALDLNGAMSALSSAKSGGQLGEKSDGYLGVVSASAQAQEIARLINDARRTEYQRLAQQNGIKLSDVEAMAGKKAIDKTPTGQYINLGSSWQKK